uniref:Upf1 domain-containing protein n=1 Tax=Ditylenchus dipsaci TaxID=166011 RepID=A0A915CYN8_9BILA
MFTSGDKYYGSVSGVETRSNSHAGIVVCTTQAQSHSVLFAISGEAQLECYHCASKNVFMLGYIPAKGDSVVVILCRQPCASQIAIKNGNWHADDWKPLIDERQILPWIIKAPSEQEQLRPDSRLRRLKQTRCRQTNLKKSVYVMTMLPITKEFSKPLVELEADYDRKEKESQLPCWTGALGYRLE